MGLVRAVLGSKDDGLQSVSHPTQKQKKHARDPWVSALEICVNAKTGDGMRSRGREHIRELKD